MITNRKIIATGALVLLIAFIVSLTPQYDSYMANDHRWTCAKLRKVIEWNYDDVIGRDADQYPAESLEAVQEVLRGMDISDDYELTESVRDGVLCEITGACREGGTFLVSFDDAGYIAVRCSLPEHDVDYTLLPEF